MTTTLPAECNAIEPTQFGTSANTHEMSHTPAGVPPTFLTIPPELRLLILEEVLVSPCSLRHVEYTPKGPEGRYSLAAILSCNRQLHRESSPVLYKRNIFSVIIPIIDGRALARTQLGPTINWAKLAIARSSFAKIEHIKIDAGKFVTVQSKDPLLATALSTVSTLFPRLQFVTINFHGITRIRVEASIKAAGYPTALINTGRLALPRIIVKGLSEEATERVTRGLSPG